MNNSETAEYIRQHYSREEYILLTLTSCSLLLSKLVDERGLELPPEIEIVEDALKVLRDSMDEKELLTVSVMMSEIDRLRDEPYESAS
jgi:hypothetical protein